MTEDIKDELILLSDSKEKSCEVCSKIFVPRIPSIHILEEDKKIKYVCSLQCRTAYFNKNIETQTCNYCGKEFKPKYAFQTFQTKGGPIYYFCSLECQRSFLDELKKEALKKEGIEKMTDATRKIAVFTQKGGTGKTTSALNLSVALSEMGYNVLLIDGDPQGNIAISFGLKNTERMKNLYDVFVDDAFPEDSLVKKTKNLHLIISDRRLAAINIILARDQESKNRHKILQQKLGFIEKEYDFIILDCSPALSVLNHNLLYFSGEVLIPVSCDYLSLAGLKQVITTLDDVRKYFNHSIEIIGIVPTFYIANQKVSKKVVHDLKNQFHDLVLAPIRESVSIRMSAFEKVAVVSSTKHQKSAGEADYHALADTISKIKTEKRRK